MLTYSSFGQQCPMGVRTHSTRGIATSGRGLAVCPLQRYVRRPAGPHHLHLPGFIIWKFRPYRPGSFLHNGLTLVIWQTNMGVCRLIVFSWPSIELRGCTDFFGMITQNPGRPLLPSVGLPYTILGPSGSLLVPKASSSVGRLPSIEMPILYWFP